MSMPHDDQTFFIAGCQRSGTTLLRLILESHDQVHCYDERTSYGILTRQHDATPWAQMALVGFKIPRFTEQFDEQFPRDYGLTDVEEENPLPFYRRQKTLFIVRDPVDVVASMLRWKDSDGVSWLWKWAAPIMEAKHARDLPWRVQFGPMADNAASHPIPAAEALLGAVYWTYKNEALLRYVKKRYPILPIRYESLVAYPTTVVARICKFLGIDLQQSMVAHSEAEHGELDERGLAVGNTDPKRSIDPHSVGAWRDVLTEEQAALIRGATAPSTFLIEKLFQ